MNITRYRSGRSPRTEPPIAFQVERQPLEQVHDISEPITTALEHFDLVVQAFDKAASLMVDEVIGNQIPSAV